MENRKRSSLARRIVAAVLSAGLLITSPGLDCYRAAAQSATESDAALANSSIRIVQDASLNSDGRLGLIGDFNSNAGLNSAFPAWGGDRVAPVTSLNSIVAGVASGASFQKVQQGLRPSASSGAIFSRPLAPKAGTKIGLALSGFSEKVVREFGFIADGAPIISSDIEEVMSAQNVSKGTFRTSTEKNEIERAYLGASSFSSASESNEKTSVAVQETVTSGFELAAPASLPLAAGLNQNLGAPIVAEVVQAVSPAASQTPVSVVMKMFGALFVVYEARANLEAQKASAQGRHYLSPGRSAAVRGAEQGIAALRGTIFDLEQPIWKSLKEWRSARNFDAFNKLVELLIPVLYLKFGIEISNSAEEVGKERGKHWLTYSRSKHWEAKERERSLEDARWRIEQFLKFVLESYGSDSELAETPSTVGDSSRTLGNGVRGVIAAVLPAAALTLLTSFVSNAQDLVTGVTQNAHRAAESAASASRWDPSGYVVLAWLGVTALLWGALKLSKKPLRESALIPGVLSSAATDKNQADSQRRARVCLAWGLGVVGMIVSWLVLPALIPGISGAITSFLGLGSFIGMGWGIIRAQSSSKDKVTPESKIQYKRVVSLGAPVAAGVGIIAMGFLAMGLLMPSLLPATIAGRTTILALLVSVGAAAWGIEAWSRRSSVPERKPGVFENLMEFWLPIGAAISIAAYILPSLIVGKPALAGLLGTLLVFGAITLASTKGKIPLPQSASGIAKTLAVLATLGLCIAGASGSLHGKEGIALILFAVAVFFGFSHSKPKTADVPQNTIQN